MNIASLNTKSLNMQNAVSLKNNSLSKNEQLKQIEEQAREIIQNNPAVKFEGNTSVNPSEIKVTVTGEMAHFDFIKDIEELSSDEKRNIHRLIQQSIKKPNGGTGDYFIMDRAQAGVQLQLIAEKLIPDKYKDQMEQVIKNYQEEGYNFDVKIYEAAQANYNKLLTKFPSLGEKSIMANGIKSLEEQEQTFRSFYSELNLSSQATFVQSFENALTKFKENQKNLENSLDDVLHQFQDELRTKWNDFASILNDSKVYKLPTAETSFIDISL
ncbi:hypothetical protein AAGS61_10005 [Lysinibacillus sp. KU-BSD001]|uniref:hypothetical protein n=1 Tax=Lysinibacillus sp. KU-BSD001 TaxID=3141328 RepID=UPI0036EF101A